MKRFFSVFLTISLALILAANAFAARTADDVKKEQAESQKNLEAAEEEAADIESERSAAREEMEESEEQLARIINHLFSKFEIQLSIFHISVRYF